MRQRGRTEVEEELEQCEADHECGRLVLQLVESTGDNPEEETGHEESDELDRLAANVFNGEDRSPVSGEEAGDRDDQVADSVVVQIAPVRGVVVVANRSEHDRLVQVDAVECDIEQEPGRCSAKESEGVFGLAEVLDELAESGTSLLCDTRRAKASVGCIRVDLGSANCAGLG